MFRRVSHIALLAALAPAGALAQGRAEEPVDAPVDLGTISLTASSEPVAISRTGASVTVIEAAELARAPVSFGQLLARTPSVSVAANGGLGTTSSLRIRGLPAYYVGTRIDGIDVTDASNTQVAFDFGSTTTAGLSRIEVLRGSQSALYGSEAVAGVIDITTWRPETDGISGEAGIEGGSDKTWSGTVSLGWRDARSEFAVSASRTVTDGISAFAGGAEADAFRASFLSLYGSYNLTEALTLGFNGFARSNYNDFDSGSGDNPDNFAQGDLRGARLFLRAESGATRHELSFSRVKTKRDIFEFGGFTWFDSDRDQISYRGSWDSSEALSLNWGLDHTSEDFSMVSAFGSAAGGEENTSASVEALWSPREDLDLSLALRRDDNSRFGGQTTARAALAWRLDEAWILRAVAATGYRAPSLYEVYGGYSGSWGVDFTPEESRSLELGIERIFAGGSVQLTLFETRIDDQIIFDNAPFEYRQIDGITTSRGIEIAGQASLASGWAVFGNYTYSDVSIDEAGATRRAPRAPRHNLTFGIEGQLSERLSASLSASHAAGLLDEHVDWSGPVVVQEKLSDYTTVDAMLTWQMNTRAEAYLRVENLFNETYQTARNFGQPGRQVFVGLRTSF